MTRSAHATDEFDFDDELPPDVEFDLATLDGVLPGELSKHAVTGVAADGDEALPFDVEFDFAIANDTPPPPPNEDDADVNLAQMSSYKDEIARRVAANQSLLHTRQSRPRRRKYDFGTGQVFGPAGATTTITINPQCLFRAEEIAATDTVGGLGTSIVQIAIGQKIQRPGSAGQGTLTTFFAQNALANGILFDTAHPWEDIAITIAFNQTCTFSMNLYGTADID